MKRSFVGLLFLSFAVAVPIFPRVISYAPYTNRIAVPAFQERTTRHFVLIETLTEDYALNVPNEVVLYDSAGAEEPRVIAPKSSIVYDQAALYQRGDGTPLILSIGHDVVSPNSWMLPPIVSISEGGNNWREVAGV